MKGIAKTSSRAAALLAAFQFLSCVTINIYFPAAEVQKAAEEIVTDVRKGAEKPPAPQKPPAAAPGKTEGALRRFLAEVLAPREAHAQTKAETAVSNAAIRALKDSMRARQTQLAPFYDKGAVGENREGYLEARDAGSLDLQGRAALQRLISAENQDRRRLYEEVAKALNVDKSQVPRIGATFAEEWQKSARPGWQVQKPDGSWVRK